MHIRWVGPRQTRIGDHQIKRIRRCRYVLQAQIVPDLVSHGLHHDLRQEDLRRVGLREEERLPVDDVDCA